MLTVVIMLRVLVVYFGLNATLIFLFIIIIIIITVTVLQHVTTNLLILAINRTRYFFLGGGEAICGLDLHHCIERH